MVRVRRLVLLAVITVFSTFLIWLPFWLRIPAIWGVQLPGDGMETVFRNFDGPMYLVVAKTFYNFSAGNLFEFPLRNEYYAAHFPLYPLLIRGLGVVFSYPWSMLIVTLLSSVLAVGVFYHIARDWHGEKKAFWMSMLFLFFPARYLIVRSVGSPEPLFVALFLLSYRALTRGNYWVAGTAGALATLTKSPGILIFVAFALLVGVIKRDLGRQIKRYLPMLMIPAALLGLFGFYGLVYGDFWAYFHSGDNIHLQLLPFKVFGSEQDWVGTHWLEDIVWVYAFGIVGLMRLVMKKNYEAAVFVGVFLLSVFFVSHRDVSRYALPIMPFVLLSLGDLVEIKYIKWFIWVILLPVFLYSINFISQNTVLVSNWKPFL